MSTNANEVTNFEQLMEKYIKDKNQILSKYDYHTPLKEIAPIEPLVFENDILQRNNTNENHFNQRNNIFLFLYKHYLIRNYHPYIYMSQWKILDI